MSTDKLMWVLRAGNTGRRGGQYGNKNAAKNEVDKFDWSDAESYHETSDFHREQRLKAKLSDEQDAAITAYTRGFFDARNAEDRLPGYADINDYLRETNREFSIPLTPEWKKRLDSSTRLLKSAARPLPKDLIVFRGIHKHSYAVGEHLKDKGFISTSLYHRTAREAFGPNTMRIHVPAGTPVVYGSNAEAELIMLPNTKFKIRNMARQTIGTLRGSVNTYDADVIK